MTWSNMNYHISGLHLFWDTLCWLDSTHEFQSDKSTKLNLIWRQIWDTQENSALQQNSWFIKISFLTLQPWKDAQILTKLSLAGHKATAVWIKLSSLVSYINYGIENAFIGGNLIS